MSLFGAKEKRENERLKKELAAARKENSRLSKRNKQLVDLCEEKDSFFKRTISDGLRHGSKEAAKHMADRKKYLNGN